MNRTRLLLVLLAVVLSTGARAQRQPVPVVDYIDVPVAKSNPRPLSALQVQEGIVAAGRKLNWEMVPAGADALTGTLVVQNRHTVVVDIPVAADKYSVKYRSSINMRYANEQAKISFRDPMGSTAQTFNSSFGAGAGPAVRVIHPAYNQWVKELMTAIDGELRVLDSQAAPAPVRAPAPAAGTAAATPALDFATEARKSARILGCTGGDVRVAGAERGNVLFIASCGGGRELTLSCDAAGLCLKRE